MRWGACFWSYDCDIRPVTCEVLMCQSRWHNIDRTEQTCHTTKFSSLPFVKNCWKMTEHSANLLSRQNLDIPKHHWMTFHSLWISPKMSHLHFQPQNSLLESRLISTTLGLKSLPSCFVLFFLRHFEGFGNSVPLSESVLHIALCIIRKKRSSRRPRAKIVHLLVIISI